MISLWQKTAELPHFDRLNQDIQTDVLVVGGGIAGILCAWQLKEAGIDCTLIEAQTLGNGITKNTTAKITAQHGLIYDKLIREFGVKKAEMYLNANLSAVEKYRTLCRKIDCDFEDRTSCVYTLQDKKKIDKELRALQQLNYHAERVDQLPLPFSVAGAIEFKNQAQFHPLRFLATISQKLRVYEHTAVLAFHGLTAVTERGNIKAKRIIIATHFPMINKHGNFFLKMYQHRSYVIALEGADEIHEMLVDEDETGLSFRSFHNLLLLGGGGHRTGKQGGNWNELRNCAQRYYPRAKEVFAWATQDCMTLDGVPYIGRYSANTENLYVATGFNKWGMTSAMVAATILTDEMQGRSNPYSLLFSPSRTILRPQLALNAWEATVGLLSPAKHRCPHLDCALKWNPIEHTWDCTCHGSRFDERGHLIDNPATGNLDMQFRAKNG